MRDQYDDIFDQMKRHLCALSYNHRYTDALLAQRDGVLKTVRDNECFRDADYPFMPVFWSADPKWNATLNLTSVLREGTLLRELESMHDIVETPTRPYFIFGVYRDKITRGRRHREEFLQGKNLTAAEIVSFVFFTETLLWKPSIRYAAWGSRLPEQQLPILGLRDGVLTFRTNVNGEVAMPVILHRECFL